MNTNACGDYRQHEIDFYYYYQDAGDSVLRRGNSTWYCCVEPTCHGCEGKGWVSPTYGVAAICPVCKGSGKPDHNRVLPGDQSAPSYPTTEWVDCSDWVVPVLTASTFKPYGRHDYEEIRC